MSENKMKVALVDKDGAVVFVHLERPSDIAKPSCNFIAAYLDDLGYARNGYAVQEVSKLDKQPADFLVALGNDGLCSCKPFAREKIADAQYLAFVGLPP